MGVGVSEGSAGAVEAGTGEGVGLAEARVSYSCPQAVRAVNRAAADSAARVRARMFMVSLSFYVVWGGPTQRSLVWMPERSRQKWGERSSTWLKPTWRRLGLPATISW